MDSGGNLVTHFTQGAGIDEPLALTGTGGTYYYHADALGSITSLTNGSGQLAASYVYDSFGKLTASTGTVANPFQYTGREFDSETGIYYYRTRYYDASTGRFISEDPIGLNGGTNSYRYVHNRATNLIDPSGLWPWDPVNKPLNWLDCLAVDLISPTMTCTWQNGHAVVQYIKDQPGLSIHGAYGGLNSPKRLHCDETSVKYNSGGYKFWSSKSTEEIINSLKPGSEEPLTVKPDGTIMQGNTRALILQQRGVNLEDLPAVSFEPTPIEPIDPVIPE